jgi:hypothetical protein
MTFEQINNLAAELEDLRMKVDLLESPPTVEIDDTDLAFENSLNAHIEFIEQSLKAKVQRKEEVCKCIRNRLDRTYLKL